jgi:stage V sporulation protein SpoVS
VLRVLFYGSSAVGEDVVQKTTQHFAMLRAYIAPQGKFSVVAPATGRRADSDWILGRTRTVVELACAPP